MERIDFNFILNLIEDGDLDSASFLMKENAPTSFELLYKSMDESIDSQFTKSCYSLLSNQLVDFSPNLLSIYFQKEFVGLERLFLHSNAFLYGTDYLALSQSFNRYLTKILKELKKHKIDELEPEQMMELLNSTVTRRFILENISDNSSSLSHILDYQSISSYSLSILHLIIAERLQLPIFGLPFEDRLVLVYTNPYCTHNESVYEEDILYYNIVGERDIHYTPFDLELLSMLNNTTLSLAKKLPKSNSVIIQKWINYVLNEITDIPRKKSLSRKYQQICELSSQFESF